MRIAVITLRVPLKPEYPFRAWHRDARQRLANAAVEGVQYEDCVGGKITVTVEVQENEETG